MITGYFLINKRHATVKKVVLETMFYGLFAVVLFVFISMFFGGFSILSTSIVLEFIVQALFIPNTSGAWWFVSVYILILMTSPVINNYLLKLNRVGFIYFIAIYWLYGIRLLIFQMQHICFYIEVFSFI